jgi:tetratricopeptide (TPR) repeat protein
MDDIRQWLNNGRHYDDGVALLIKYCTDAKLKRLYTTEGASDFKKTRLLQELQTIFAGAGSPLPGGVRGGGGGVEGETVNGKLPTVNPSKWPAEMDSVVAALFEQWKPLFSERNDLCSRLDAIARAGDENKTGKMAHRILDLDDAVDDLYAKRDYYLQHGKLPQAKQPRKMAVDPIKMAVVLKNHERYVREFKRKLKTNASNVKWAAKLKEHEDAVAYYKQQLKIDG